MKGGGRRIALLALRVVLAAAGVAYIVTTVSWPELASALRRADVPRLLAGFVLIAPMILMAACRWWLLLRARGFAVSRRKALELTLAGNFFNFCLPGLTSGDVVRAFYAARGTDRRTDAVLTVVVDRAFGLLALLVVAGSAGLLLAGDPVVRKLTIVSWVLAAALVAAAAFLASGTAARIPIARRLAASSAGKTLDAALRSFRLAPAPLLAVIGLSLGAQLLLTVATILAGRALGLDVPLRVLVVVVPLLYLSAAVPLTYQGLGVMEALGVALLGADTPVAANAIVGMLLISRLYRLGYASLGAVVLLRGNLHLHRPDADS